jgi:3',5'-cyclic-AMP phosphodiesterase
VGYRHFDDFFGVPDSVKMVPCSEGRAKVVATDSTRPELDEGEVGREHPPTWVAADPGIRRRR